MAHGTIEQFVQSLEPAALLVEPQVVRRVIRLDRGIQGLRLLVPHRESYTIGRDRLLTLVERWELELSAEAELPARVILLSRLDEEDLGDTGPSEQLFRRYTQSLFHACVHLELESHFGPLAALEQLARERRAQIGEVEFSEIRSVLLKDDYLFPPPSDIETYVEFVALYLELRYFAPHELVCYFPAIRDWTVIDRIVSQDIDHQRLFARFQYDATEPARRAAEEPPEVETPPLDSEPILPPEYRRLQLKADRAASVGNGVKAVLARWRAAQLAPAGFEADANAVASLELLRFAHRLQGILQLPGADAEQWARAIEPLLRPASVGFLTKEARLLYDLQKVCIEEERKIRRVNLAEWILSFGKRPFDRPLPLLSEALAIRHLRTAMRRLAGAHIDVPSRQRLSALLDRALPHVESRSRARLRKLMTGVFDEVGLRPQNVPEGVARKKIIEELIDQILERSYLRMADLRDALSKSDLKLPDVSSVAEVLDGDRLLKADLRFDTVLDGIYRRGTVYQRWPQMLSSLAFGTKVGRFLTLFLIVPYGGAFLMLECLRHLGVLPGGKAHHVSSLVPTEGAIEAAQTSTGLMFTATVLLLGTWLSFLIHRPAFLAWNISVLRTVGRVTRTVFIELPTQLLHSKYMQQILTSHAFMVVRNYMLRTALFTAWLWLMSKLLGYDWTNRLILEVFLVTSLFLNSAVGRYVADAVTDFFIRFWHELRIRVFAAVFQWIMDFFRGLLATLERVLYAIDEWLRFRTGDNVVVQGLKLIGGVFWFFVAYIVIFVFTLLVEPQINPIKHFPVVTVSHKLILPTGPVIVKQLSPYLGTALANTVVWSTIWLIPGVFGFLVWELKENWRLYAANRPRVLRPEPIGSHGETMLQLLSPGFHSGTLPRAFAALRRAARKGHSPDTSRLRRRWATVRRAELSVQRFVERELLNLLTEIEFAPNAPMSVSSVHASTNQISVELSCAERPQQRAVLAWEFLDGQLVATVAADAWLECLDDAEREKLSVALAGLSQRSGARKVVGLSSDAATSAVTWDDWLDTWHSANQQWSVRQRSAEWAQA